jgi:hypothetical protein
MAATKGPAMRRTTPPVEEFLARIPDEQRRQDAQQLCAMTAEVTGELPAMWGTSIIGFGAYHYFSPRSQQLAIYLAGEFENRHQSALARLGPHKAGKGCLYIKRLGRWTKTRSAG